MESDRSGSRRHRWQGLVGLAGRRLLDRTTDGAINRVTLAMVVVAITVALLVVVTGISVGLTAQSTVYSDDVDYWIAPESGTSLTTVVSVQSPQLGNAHQTTANITAIEGVSDATPVLVEIVRMRAPDSTEPEYILGIGVIPGRSDMQITGLSTKPLEPGDPHYGTGEYDGELTGEVVLSPAAASLLNASAGDDLVVGSPASGNVRYSDFEVTAVGDAETQAAGGVLPVAVLHLSELQSLAGATEGDHANQFLVRTNEPGVRSQLEGVYPEATVTARGSLNARQVTDSDLPLAISVSALVVTLVIAGLFIATTMGLEVESDRQFLAVLAAVGIAPRGRLLVVAATTLMLTVLGGLGGVLLGAIGIVLLNAVATMQFGIPAIAQFHPLLALYGLGVALLTGSLAALYPVLVARGTPTSEVLN